MFNINVADPIFQIVRIPVVSEVNFVQIFFHQDSTAKTMAYKLTVLKRLHIGSGTATVLFLCTGIYCTQCTLLPYTKQLY
jgi:hypothetical protein